MGIFGKKTPQSTPRSTPRSSRIDSPGTARQVTNSNNGSPLAGGSPSVAEEAEPLVQRLTVAQHLQQIKEKREVDEPLTPVAASKLPIPPISVLSAAAPAQSSSRVPAAVPAPARAVPFGSSSSSVLSAAPAQAPSSSSSSSSSTPVRQPASLDSQKASCDLGVQATLGHGMDLRKVDTWAEPEWSGSATDRPSGSQGQPTASKDAGAGGKKGPNLEKSSVEMVGGVVFDREEIWREMQPAKAAPTYELPDLSGRWKCINVSGDWDAYLKLEGVPIMQRNMAKAMAYGKGRAIQMLDVDELKATMTLCNEVMKAGATRWNGLRNTKEQEGAGSSKNLTVERMESLSEFMPLSTTAEGGVTTGGGLPEVLVAPDGTTAESFPRKKAGQRKPTRYTTVADPSTRHLVARTARARPDQASASNPPPNCLQTASTQREKKLPLAASALLPALTPLRPNTRNGGRVRSI